MNTAEDRLQKTAGDSNKHPAGKGVLIRLYQISGGRFQRGLHLSRPGGMIIYDLSPETRDTSSMTLISEGSGGTGAAMQIATLQVARFGLGAVSIELNCRDLPEDTCLCLKHALLKVDDLVALCAPDGRVLAAPLPDGGVRLLHPYGQIPSSNPGGFSRMVLLLSVMPEEKTLPTTCYLKNRQGEEWRISMSEQAGVMADRL